MGVQRKNKISSRLLGRSGNRRCQQMRAMFAQIACTSALSLSLSLSQSLFLLLASSRLLCCARSLCTRTHNFFCVHRRCQQRTGRCMRRCCSAVRRRRQPQWRRTAPSAPVWNHEASAPEMSRSCIARSLTMAKTPRGFCGKCIRTKPRRGGGGRPFNLLRWCLLMMQRARGRRGTLLPRKNKIRLRRIFSPLT